MKGQTEIIVFILLFLIGVSLFMASIIWSRSILDRNTDVMTLNTAESFMNKLDDKIDNIIRFGGKDSLNYNLDATIEIKEIDEIIEIKTPLDVALYDEWVNLKENGSIIRERMEGNLFRIQLYYPGTPYDVDLFTEGPRIATPTTVLVEKISSDEPGKIRIKVTFQ